MKLLFLISIFSVFYGADFYLAEAKSNLKKTQLVQATENKLTKVTSPLSTKVVRDINVAKTKQSTNKLPQAKRDKNYLLKSDSLPKDYYQQNKTKEELQKNFEEQLNKLSKVCDLKVKEAKEYLEKQVQEFFNFMEHSLKDPYMDYVLNLLFSDVSSTLKNELYENSIDSETFNLIYRRLYNIPETTNTENYPHQWAKTIYQSIKCMENKNTKK